MKNYLNLLRTLFLALVAVTFMGCSSDEGEEWGGFKFENVHDGKVSVAANQTSAQIIMQASKAYSAYVSATSDGSSTEEVTWLHYNGSNLDDGKCYVSFTLDRNFSGKSRSAYIIIQCDDKTVPILVTQTTENDPDWEEGVTALFTITKENTAYYSGKAEDDGTESYEFQYVSGRLFSFKHVFNDEISDGSDPNADQYCIETTQVERIDEYDGVLDTHWLRDNIYYPSNKKEGRVIEHHAKLENGRIVSGTIFDSWMLHTCPFELSYNSDGTLKQYRYNDIGDDGSDDWDNHSFVWENGYLTKVNCGNMDATSTFAYDKTTAIPAPFDTALDLNMLLILEEAEFFDGKNGEILNVFAIGGKLGTRSKGLIKEFHCDWTEDTPYTLKMSYEKLTGDEVVVTVDHYEKNVKRFSSKWTIKRS